MRQRARSLLRWLDRVETGLIALLVLAMVLLAGAQILLRNLFDTGLEWADPLLRAMVLWAAMLGALAAVRDDKHIGLDILAHFVHGRVRRVIHALTLAFSAGMAGLMAWHGYALVLLDYGGDARIAGIPTWLVELIVPVGFGLIALRLLVHVFLPPRNEDMPVLAPELP